MHLNISDVNPDSSSSAAPEAPTALPAAPAALPAQNIMNVNPDSEGTATEEEDNDALCSALEAAGFSTDDIEYVEQAKRTGCLSSSSSSGDSPASEISSETIWQFRSPAAFPSKGARKGRSRSRSVPRPAPSARPPSPIVASVDRWLAETTSRPERAVPRWCPERGFQNVAASLVYQPSIQLIHSDGSVYFAPLFSDSIQVPAADVQDLVKPLSDIFTFFPETWREGELDWFRPEVKDLGYSIEVIVNLALLSDTEAQGLPQHAQLLRIFGLQELAKTDDGGRWLQFRRRERVKSLTEAVRDDNPF